MRMKCKMQRFQNLVPKKKAGQNLSRTCPTGAQSPWFTHARLMARVTAACARVTAITMPTVRKG